MQSVSRLLCFKLFSQIFKQFFSKQELWDLKKFTNLIFYTWYALFQETSKLECIFSPISVFFFLTLRNPKHLHASVNRCDSYGGVLTLCGRQDWGTRLQRKIMNIVKGFTATGNIVYGYLCAATSKQSLSLKYIAWTLTACFWLLMSGFKCSIQYYKPVKKKNGLYKSFLVFSKDYNKEE